MPPKVHTHDELCAALGIKPVSPMSSGRAESPARKIATLDIETKPCSDESALNKTEAAWLDVMRGRGYEDIGIQDMTFKIGNQCRYTPDFRAVIDGRMVLFEVKGFMREDAHVKIKATARKFRRFDFVLIQRIKNEWIETPVKP